MPRLSPGQILFLIFLAFAFLWSQNPAMFRSGESFNSGLQTILASALAIILAITVHEFLHAATAVSLGDPTPKLMGRLSLNPIRHLDPIGTLLLFVAQFGWGKPVLFNPMNLRISPQLGSAMVSFAGPLANVLFAMLLWSIFKQVRGDLGPGLRGFAAELIQINIALAAFNLVPIPPLDGFGVVHGLLPTRVAILLNPLRTYGPLILMAAVFLPQLGGPNVIGPIMRPIINVIQSIVLGV